jgi:ribosome-binding factor A
MTLRQEKVSSAIKRIAGEYININHSNNYMITPIKTDVSKDLEKSTIYVTVFPEEKEYEAIKNLKRKRSDFRDFFKNQIKIKTIPIFDFEIDLGEKNRQRIDDLSTK